MCCPADLRLRIRRVACSSRLSSTLFLKPDKLTGRPAPSRISDNKKKKRNRSWLHLPHWHSPVPQLLPLWKIKSFAADLWPACELPSSVRVFAADSRSIDREQRTEACATFDEDIWRERSCGDRFESLGCPTGHEYAIGGGQKILVIDQLIIINC